MSKPLSLLAALLFYTCGLLAQAPPIAWQKCFGGPYLDFGVNIEPAKDGGYIMTGYTYGPGGDVSGYHGSTPVGDYWVVKMDATGTIQWPKCLGGTYFDAGWVVHQTPDGGYIVGGQAASLEGDGDVTTTSHGGTDFWIVKLSAAGAILWQKNIGGEANEYLYALELTPDGGYVLAGTTQSMHGDVSGNHGGANDIWV